MTDFLDLLEDDLRGAAERRGRRRRPVRALKAVAVVAAIAVVAVGGVQVADLLGSPEETAQDPPAVPQLSREDAPVAVIAAGQVGASQVIASRLTRWGYEVAGPSTTAPDDLGSMVLYRPGADKLAADIGERLQIGAVRPLSPADEKRLGGGLSKSKLVVVFGFDLQDRVLQHAGECQAAGGDLRLCSAMSEAGSVTAFYDGDGRLPIRSPRGIGHWRWAALSPDGRTILAQWSAECEVPQAYLIDRERGRLRRVGGVSTALGWTTDGRAIVFLPADGGCGGAEEPGVYLVSRDGRARMYIIPSNRREPPRRLPPSVTPRNLVAIERSAG